MLRALPNAITLCNLCAGSCAIAALFEGQPRITLVLAIICLVLDVLDGYLARQLNASSELGLHLDSLADLVSFGVLPASILFVFLHAECGTSSLPDWIAYAAFLHAGAVALRLARFNIDTRERKVFFGLPTPSAATLLFGLLWMQTIHHPWWDQVCSPALYVLLLFLPALMLSNLRLWSLKGVGSASGKRILGFLLLVFVILVLLTGVAAVPLIVFAYVLFGLVNLFVKFY